MAPHASSARRGRRLLAAILAALSMFAAVTTLATPSTRAASQPGDAVGRTLLTPTPRPSVSISPTCDPFGDQAFCPSPSPSPSVVVVSPVPDTPSPSPTTPSYLVGGDPTPSPNIGDTVSSPVPLGGGFVDQLPTPSGAAAAPPGALAPHSSGLPLPFIAVGVVLILGAVGSLIYALAPREKKIFTPGSRPSATPVAFTPFGPERPGTNILSGSRKPTPTPRNRN